MGACTSRAAVLREEAVPNMGEAIVFVPRVEQAPLEGPWLPRGELRAAATVPRGGLAGSSGASAAGGSGRGGGEAGGLLELDCPEGARDRPC